MAGVSQPIRIVPVKSLLGLSVLLNLVSAHSYTDIFTKRHWYSHQVENKTLTLNNDIGTHVNWSPCFQMSIDSIHTFAEVSHLVLVKSKSTISHVLARQINKYRH